jgi:hypothetical protein
MAEEIKRLKAVIIKHETRIRALEAPKSELPENEEKHSSTPHGPQPASGAGAGEPASPTGATHTNNNHHHYSTNPDMAPDEV